MAEAMIVCPLEFERHLLVKAGLPPDGIVCCGPGAGSVRRWAPSVTAPARVILCGLAGSLRGDYAPGSAYMAAEVLGAGGRRLVPPGARAAAGPVIASVPRTLTTPAAKRRFAEQSGADLADLESAAFAEIAQERGWRWSVVRGVSDGPQTRLPDDVDEWVDCLGRTRPGRACRALLLGRVAPFALLRLGADARRAMRAAAAAVRRILGDTDA